MRERGRKREELAKGTLLTMLPPSADEQAAMDARDRVDRRAQKRAHRAQLASETRHLEEHASELREVWRQVAGSTEQAAISHADCKRAFVIMGMSGMDLRGMLPGGPPALRAFYEDRASAISFAGFDELVRARMVHYDGPCCNCCGSIQSSTSERFECENHSGLCSVFAAALGADSAGDEVPIHALEPLESAVLAALSFQAGLEPWGGEAPPEQLQTKAAQVARAAMRALQSSNGARDCCAVIRVQEFVEEAIVTC